MVTWNQTVASNGFAVGTMWLLVYGGEQQDVYGDLHWYHVARNTWYSTSFAATTAVPPALSQSEMIALSNGQVLLIGGSNPRGRSNTTWMLSPATVAWASSKQLDLPSGGGAVHCAARRTTGKPFQLVAKGPAPLPTSSDAIAQVYCLPSTGVSTLEIARLQVPMITCSASANLILSASGDSCSDCGALGAQASSDGLRCDPVSNASLLASVLGGSLGGAAALVVLVIVVAVWRSGSNARNTKYAPRDSSKPFAIAFTDIESSTSLWARAPREMGPAIDLHHAIIRDVVKECKGYEVKTIGDSFMVAFEDPADCVEFCARTQRALLNHPDWPRAGVSDRDLFNALYEGIAAEKMTETNTAIPVVSKDETLWRGLRVRIGAHFGVGSVKFDDAAKGYDYYGSVVNAAARIESVGNGGQIAVSRALWAAAQQNLKSSSKITVTPCGLVPLRGFDEPFELMQLNDGSLIGRKFAPLRIEGEAGADDAGSDKGEHASTPSTRNATPADGASDVSEGLAPETAAKRFAKGDERRANGLLALYLQLQMAFAPFPQAAARTTLDGFTQKWRIAPSRSRNFEADLMSLAKKIFSTCERNAAFQEAVLTARTAQGNDEAPTQQGGRRRSLLLAPTDAATGGRRKSASQAPPPIVYAPTQQPQEDGVVPQSMPTPAPQ